jgi:hypothetical protein
LMGSEHGSEQHFNRNISLGLSTIAGPLLFGSNNK